MVKARLVDQGAAAVTTEGKQHVLQFVIFEEEDPRHTKMVALYDLAPRFVFDTNGDEDGQRKLIEREFSFAGKRYRITIKPTVMKDEDGTLRTRYPGEREQIVEEVIRRLAAEKGRLSLQDSKVRFPFSLYEVREELARVKHSYNTSEIKQAILILNECPVGIHALEDSKRLLSASAFPVIGMRTRNDSDDAETFVEFNPMVADAIRRLAFRQVSYELLMEIRDPIARWLYKRLHQEIASNGRDVQQMLATEIRRDSGMAVWKKTRSMLARVRRAVEVLQERGLLAEVECEDQMVARRKDDILFVMKPSAEMMREVQRANRQVEDDASEYARLSGDSGTDEFRPVEREDLNELRNDRRRRRFGVVESAPRIAAAAKVG
ncbi:hypothetical protein SAE02_39010 [Skermanella aerolata]|uniref:Plasmid replication protein n=1 Tax=Skermanella aerolata TaxID=393310 RepID=A0A512DTG4_9PROT|nr:hypothetical protein SAE02_39010 [Skermanella aerolata]